MLSFNTKNAIDYADSSLYLEKLKAAREICGQLYADRESEPDVKGWLDPMVSAVQLDAIKKKGAEIYRNADILLLVGVGGSNQAARAMLEALSDSGGPEVIYAGHTLSAYEFKRITDRLRGKSVYMNVIAKNFETLEPGSHFRVLRLCMEDMYGPTGLGDRIVLTGTRGTRLEDIANQLGSLFLEFPEDIGGRYSAFSPVALLPLAARGLDIDRYLLGALQMMEAISGSAENPAAEYAALRNTLYDGGFIIELLAAFEPRLSWFGKWWIQLFGESEGKQGKGIFPSSVIYSEDLHSMGQYLQEGPRHMLETFISVDNPGASLIIESDPAVDDRFDYLDGMDFAEINSIAYKSTLEAHSSGGVPCMEISLPALDEFAFGQLYYFFMAACAVSGKLLGVNPFDQDGVEEYKRRMFGRLKTEK